MIDFQDQIIVLDANLLLRLADKSSPWHTIASAAVMTLLSSGALLRTLPQSLFEFWAVATRPLDKNGLGLSVQEAEAELLSLAASFPVLPDDPAYVTFWRHLAVKYSITGVRAHDTRCIGSMQAHGLTYLLTFDSDFRRYAADGITIIDPISIPVPQ